MPGPQINPADIINWPILKIVYRTDKDKVAALLPPGIDPGDEPNVHLNVYCVPVPDEPEYGVLYGVDADYKGQAGMYALGYAIDQEAAVFISQERWGQPKYPARIHYFRMMDHVEGRVVHQGHSFIEFRGDVVGTQAPPADADQNEWWIKCVRDVDLTPGQYDFPPHVVHVYSRYATAHLQKLEGEIPSPANPPPGCKFHTRCPHAAEICRTEEPVLDRWGAAHDIACHRWQELEDATPAA